MCALLVLGIAFGLLMGALSDVLATRQGNADTRFGFLIIAPAITFVCVISGFRGYFQGQMYMLPTALSNVVEQVVKLAVGIGASYALAKRGVIYAVCGALFGVTVSEIVTAAYMGVTYLSARKRKNANNSSRECRCKSAICNRAVKTTFCKAKRGRRAIKIEIMQSPARPKKRDSKGRRGANSKEC